MSHHELLAAVLACDMSLVQVLGDLVLRIVLEPRNSDEGQNSACRGI